jgi:hypothetical protein
MQFEIKNRWDGSTIYKDEADSFAALVIAAIKAKASLRYANLLGADLQGADLRGANLQGAIGLLPIVPEAGVFHGFKKLADNSIAEIQIPADAERVGGYISRKCRASKAIVISGQGFSKHDPQFAYAPGQVIVPDEWDNDPRVECSHGIHFFLTRKEAESY